MLFSLRWTNCIRGLNSPGPTIGMWSLANCFYFFPICFVVVLRLHEVTECWKSIDTTVPLKRSLVSIGKGVFKWGKKADKFGSGTLQGRAFSISERFTRCFPAQLCHWKFRFLQESSFGIQCKLSIQLQLWDFQMLCKLIALNRKKRTLAAGL